MTENNKPLKVYRSGRISVTVWEQTATDKEGKERTFLSYALNKNYTDNNGVWKATNNFNETDLLRLHALVAQVVSGFGRTTDDNEYQTKLGVE